MEQPRLVPPPPPGFGHTQIASGGEIPGNRFEVLDGFRGYFLVFMVVHHLKFKEEAKLALINHSTLGFVEDAQGFIFISGLLVGLLYARGYQGGRNQDTDKKLFSRGKLLFKYNLAATSLIVLMALLVPSLGKAWDDWLLGLQTAPLESYLHMAAMSHQPKYLDILPQYILYLVVSPFALRALLRRNGFIRVALCSLGCWVAVQLDLHVLLTLIVGSILFPIFPDFSIRAYFNPFAWQIVYMGGLIAGAAVSTRRFDPRSFIQNRSSYWIWIAVAVLLAFASLRIGLRFGFIERHLAAGIVSAGKRGNFGWAYVLNFAALLFVVAWIFFRVGETRRGFRTSIRDAIRSLMGTRFLQLLGRHSLQVYAFHTVVIYLWFGFQSSRPVLPEWGKSSVLLLAIASLALPALAHELYRRRRRPLVLASRIDPSSIGSLTADKPRFANDS